MAKTIVFCVDSEHALQMQQELHKANEDLTRQYPHYVARIVSAEGDLATEHLENFADPESNTPVIATTSKLLSTGVDIPTCRNIVLFKPIGSIVEFKQIIGRGTRLYPDQDKLTFQIVDYSHATALFADPDFDGFPEIETVEQVNDEGEHVAGEVSESAQEYVTGEPGEVDPEDLGREGAKKFYVDEGEVYVAAEAVYVLEPDGTGLKVVSYEQYVANGVRRLFPDPTDLRGRWRTSDGRDEVIEALAARGITFEDLAERTGLVDADPFDLLVYVAWNGPLSSRRDRANRVRKESAEFLATFAPEARAILEELLEKYSDHGIAQLDDMHVLEVPPLSGYGSPVEIATRFGGPDQLRKAVGELQALLYVA